MRMTETDVQLSPDAVIRGLRLDLPLLLVAALFLSGCSLFRSKPTTMPTSQPAASAALPPPFAAQPGYVYQELLPGETIAADDNLSVLVEVIRIAAPIGSLSGSPAFWQVTSDRMLTPRQQQSLLANGMHFATIEASAWSPLKSEIERHAGVTSRTSMARGTGRAEIDIRSVLSQTLFFFSVDGQLQGRSYGDSDNFWGLRFAPDPAERGKIALDICPVVRTSRRETRVTKRNNEFDVDFTQPEAMYDMGMQLRLPVGLALVMAPTSAVRSDSSLLGRAFLTAEDSAGLMEYVLVLYPRLYRLNAKLTQQQFEEALGREKLHFAEPSPPAPDRR